jgi:hypothetical protein
METHDGNKISAIDVATNSRVIPELVDNGNKNLLNVIPNNTINTSGTWSSGNKYVANGLTCTFSDKKITVSGTCTTDGIVVIAGPILSGMKGYILTGRPSSVSPDISTNHNIRLAAFTVSRGDCVANDNDGSGAVIESDDPIYIAIYTYAGFSCNSLVFEPMVCTSEALEISNTFKPYKTYTNPCIMNYRLSSTSPIVIGPIQYTSFIIMGFVQGIGAVMIMVLKNASTLTCINMQTGSAFSSTSLNIQLTDSMTVTISSTLASVSEITIVIGGKSLI